MAKALDHLSVETYHELQNKLITDVKVSEHLFVSPSLLVEWKRENDLINGTGRGKKKRMSDEKRMEIFKRLTSESVDLDEIAKQMLLTRKPLNRWIRELEKLGRS